MRLIKIKNKKKSQPADSSTRTVDGEDSMIPKRMLRVIIYVVMFAFLVLFYLIISTYDTSKYLNDSSETDYASLKKQTWSSLFSEQKNETKIEKFLIYNFLNDGIFSQFIRLKLVSNFSRNFNRTVIIPPNHNERLMIISI